MSPNWFQFDPDCAPDTNFEPGELHHLCVGNEGRLLDFRRTPVRVLRLCDETGLATIEILAFEDKGALWDLPYEDIGTYQFKKGSLRNISRGSRPDRTGSGSPQPTRGDSVRIVTARFMGLGP